MADEKKYLSKIAKGSDTLWLKDAEARQEIADIKSSITGAMHYAGVTTTEISDGSTTGTITISGESYTAKNGDVVIYGELEFVWNGSKWQELGSTGSLKALAFKDSASATYTPAGTNAASAVSFTGQTSGTFVTGFNDDAVAPSLGAATTGSFVTGFDQSPVAPSFSEGSFTPASFQTGFATAGSAASFTEGTFSAGSLPSFTEGACSAGSLPALGAGTTRNFAPEGEKSTYDEANETLTLSAATTAAAVTAQGTFTPATYGTDTFDGGTPTAVDVSKFSGGSKAADTWNAGTLPTKAADSFSAGNMTTLDLTKFNGGSKAADTFSAGSAATPTTATAVTAVGTGEAAAQVFSGTQATITVE